MKPKAWMSAIMGGYVALLIWFGKQSADWPGWAYWVLIVVGCFVYGVLRLVDFYVATRRSTGGDS